MDVVTGKVKEYQNLTLQLTSQLDHLVKDRSPDHYPKPSQEPYITKDVLKIAGKSISEVIKHLSTQYLQKNDIDTHISGPAHS